MIHWLRNVSADARSCSFRRRSIRAKLIRNPKVIAEFRLMPAKTARKPKPVVLDFGDLPKSEREPRLLDISAVVQCGPDLWVASDETTSVERLAPCGGGHFGKCESFALSDFLQLPTTSKEEIDIEGLAFDDQCLWITGSHALKRSRPEDDGDDEQDIEALAEIVRETNRFLIGRIPLHKDPATGVTSLQRECTHQEKPDRILTAAQLFGTAKSNMLVDALRDDNHLGRFLAIPAKENGFDIEGMAVMGSRIFLGLRGPVLRGWAVILEIKVEPISAHHFQLVPIGPEKCLYRKHFFDLAGLGVRELCQDGDDLLILAGPTMDLDGCVLVHRWKNVHKHRKQTVVGKDELKTVLKFEFSSKDAGKDHPEGLCLYSDAGGHRGLLVVYDSPAESRLTKRKLVADLFPFK
jgi:hypothetical protein